MTEHKEYNVSEILKPKDRKDLFVLMCKNMCLDPDKEAEKLKVKKGPAGFVVNLDKLMLFFKAHKIGGKFDFSTGTMTVKCPIVLATGKTAIENPETIKPTSVDEKKEEEVIDEKEEEVVLEEGTAPKPGSDLSPLEDVLLNDEEDDDSPF